MLPAENCADDIWRQQRETELSGISKPAQPIDATQALNLSAVTFDPLFAFLVLGHGRRQLLWFEVTRHPTAEWLARQITEAFPWASAPAYLVRDNDGVTDMSSRPG